MKSKQSLHATKAAARKSLTSGRYHEASKLLEAVSGEAADAETWQLRGVASGLVGNTREAERCFQEAIRLQPDWAEAYFNLGNALLMRGELHSAAEVFATAIGHKPNYQQAITAFHWTDRRRWGKQRIAVEIEGGLHVTCPRSLQCATTYVLLEQEDWFEPEILFLRQLAQPGMTALDIGANHGVYALTLAKAAGTSGHVWAFEPATDPADCLAESLILNDFSNVTLVRRALSNHDGEGTLLIEESPELNRLVQTATETDEVETVRLSTLDSCATEFGWHDIDFIKLDAEGAEALIIEGGQKFLSSSSPLIMFEVRHKSQLNIDLVDRFHALGFESYCYVPGIHALAPWNANQASHHSQINLFCARPDRAAVLATRGLLVSAAELQREPPSFDGAWAVLHEHLPCYQKEESAQQPDTTHMNPDNEVFAAYYLALNAYAASCDSQRPLPERYLALTQALAHVESAQRIEWRPESASLLTRVMSALGSRQESLQSLHTLLTCLLSGNPATVLPLLPPDPCFDAIPVKSYASFSDWFLCSIFETWERYRGWSSFWAGPDGFNALSWLETHAQHETPEMERRRKLLEYSRRGMPMTASQSAQTTGAKRPRNGATWAMLAKAHSANQASHS